MEVLLKFNEKIYTLNLTNVDIWTHQAGMSDSDMKTFIEEVIKNNPNLLKLK